MKKGCFLFILVVLVLAVGAGVSVLMKGKSMKPKSRALIVSRPNKILEKLEGTFAKDVSEGTKKKFEEAYKKLTSEIIQGAMQNPGRVGAAVEMIKSIEADGKITNEEAEQIIKFIMQPNPGDKKEQPASAEQPENAKPKKKH